MTGVVALVAWVDQSSWVVGGQGVLYLMKNCARDKSFHVSWCVLN